MIQVENKPSISLNKAGLIPTSILRVNYQN